MAINIKPARIGFSIPTCCPKCGSLRMEVTDEGLECIKCGWVQYLTERQLKKIRRMGLDKIKCVLQNKLNGG